MKRYIAYMMAVCMALLAAGCAKESGFDINDVSGSGKFLTSALSIQVSGDVNAVRADDTPSVDDFIVNFRKDGTLVATYRYVDMPEVVSLPVGEYTVEASYGDNVMAAFDSPYYNGVSKPFSVEKNRVTDTVSPIVCRLANVKVFVGFDRSLVETMSDDSKVTVKVGRSGSLVFTKDEVRFGYFAYYEGSSTLAATFEGMVEGYPTNETKTYDNVMAGNYYRVTFSLHSPGDREPGDIVHDGTGVNVDADVEIVTIGGGDTDIPVNDELIDDPDRNESETPVDPTPPGPPTGDGPGITPEGGLILEDGEVLEGGNANVYNEGMQCVINIKSETGIEGFVADIVSPNLTEDEMQSVGLTTHLDLVNPGERQETLESLLGISLGDSIKGSVENIRFDISSFMPLLAIFGPGTHRFILRVSDSEGAVVKTLIIRFE